MTTEKYTPLRDDPNELVRLLVEKDHEIANLRHLLILATNRQYGPKTERLKEPERFYTGEIVTQLSFSFETPAAPVEEPVKEEEIVVEKYTRTVRRGRKPFPSSIERQEINLDPEQTHCNCCQRELVKVEEYRTEVLEKIPAQLKVIVHVRPKMACSHCKGAKVLVARLPTANRPLDGARAGAGLLADIIVSKYVDHLPLHRQEMMFRRAGVELSRKRMSEWVGRVVTELLLPVYDALKEEVLSHQYLQADETTLKIQDGEKPDVCKTGYLWGLHAPPKVVWFHYSPSRSGKVPTELLEGYRGVVQTDAYAGYNEVFLPDTVHRLACLAHIRRKFIEVQSAGGSECARVLKLITEIYRREKDVNSAEERYEIRQKHSRALFAQLFTLLKELAPKGLPRAQFSQAIQYALNQEAAVMRILESGEHHLDNNSIERQMKLIAIGRKNYYFAGSHEGGRWAAVLYSLLGTCKLHNVNPWEYLRDVMVRVNLRDGGTARELLPMYWKQKTVSPAYLTDSKATQVLLQKQEQLGCTLIL